MPNKPTDSLSEKRLLKLEPPFYLPKALPQFVQERVMHEKGTVSSPHFSHELLASDEFCAALNDALRTSLEDMLS